MAIQRQADVVDTPSKTLNVEGEEPNHVVRNEDEVDGDTAAGRTQALVNLAWITIYLGPLLAFGLAQFYTRSLKSGSPEVLEMPYFSTSLQLFGFAALWELLSEPAFVVVMQKSRFKIRAKAESVGTLARCLVTCGSAIWAARTGRELGVLPFALGQMAYAASLLVVYSWSVGGVAGEGGFSLFVKSIYSKCVYVPLLPPPLNYLDGN